jgi:pyridoxine/pyridoxamine 5'-phosphate oxidase
MATETPRELLANLLKRREELRMESEALDRLIDTYRALAVLKHEPPAEQLALWSGARSRKARSDYVAEMLAEARRLIVAEGRPLTRSELLRRLEAEGFVIDGTDKRKVLGTNIWRSKKFNHIEGKGYWPKDVPIPR